ncbi:MAG: glycosyltransferase family 2 protein, partial [Chitinophagaceae bacterium]
MITTVETSHENGNGSLELSVVIPCLNEADTLAVCIEKAQRVIHEHGIRAEVIVADNGSTDGSLEIATRLNARIVNVREKGYGSALMGGIAASCGNFIIMGDADESYDFLEIPKFLDKLRSGYDLVQGCRLPRGGGVIKEGAMPFLHRRLGNPMFTFLAGLLFKAPINDVYCGLRGFTRAHFDFLDQRCTGMEFATEMIIKSSMYNAKIAEVPITLYPDGRRSHPPHLRTFRDGWRTLRFFLLYSPRWLFYFPGRLLIFLGLLCYALALPKVSLFGLVTFDVQTMLFGSLFITCGYQAILFFILTKTFVVSEKLHPVTRRFV